MTDNAIAVTLFHAVPDAAGFDAWLPELIESALQAEGFVAASPSVHNNEQLDWALGVSFSDSRSLAGWLDSPLRRKVLDDGQTRGFWSKSSDLVMGDGRPPPGNIGVFEHEVVPGMESDFLYAQEKIIAASAPFPGSEGTTLFPPELTGRWMSMVRFRTGRDLGTWMRSTARADTLPEVRASLTRNFTQSGRIAPFGATVRTEDGLTEITPGWKVAMLVLLVVYPIVMTLTRFLAPVIADFGSPPWLTLFISQVASTALLQWAFIPLAWLCFRQWMDPVDGRGLGISVRGAVVMVILYAIILALFANVTWLDYWRH
jgi:antibiotic biosynthesis monooxygenase (ABM) superfamily enzyme